MNDPDNPRHQARGCRHIEGDPRSSDWAFCQQPTLPGYSWCAEHHAIVYQPVPKLSQRDLERQFLVRG